MNETGKQVTINGAICDVYVGRYVEGKNAAIVLMENYTPYCTATVNPSFTLANDEVVIKDWSENEGVLDALTSAGIVDVPHTPVQMGHTQGYVCRMSPVLQSALEDMDHELETSRD